MQETKSTAEQGRPLWVQAQSKQNQSHQQKKINRLTKLHYFNVLASIKELYKLTGTEVVFERVYSTHPSLKLTAMHCFMSNDVYWFIACDECFSFYIYYEIAESHLANQFKALIKSLPKDVRINEVCEPSLPIMFKRCKRLQDSMFFTTLK